MTQTVRALIGGIGQFLLLLQPYMFVNLLCRLTAAVIQKRACIFSICYAVGFVDKA